MKNYYYGFKSIKEQMFRSFEKDLQKKKIYDIRLIFHWEDIMQNFAKKITPTSISFSNSVNTKKIQKILYCTSTDRNFISEFPYYKQDLLAKLNLYFGEEKSSFVDIKIKLI